MKKILILFVVLAIVLAGVTMCANEIKGETLRWNQELTITVMTDDGPKTGSSVSAVVFFGSDSEWLLPQSRGLRSRAFGESVVIELTPGSHLAVPIEGNSTLFLRSFNAGKWNRPEIDRILAAPIGMELEVPRDQLGHFVYFADDADPSSLLPYDLGPNREKILRATIRKVAVEPVFGIDRIFPWMHWSSNDILTRLTDHGYRTSMSFRQGSIEISFGQGSFTSKMYRSEI